MSEPCPIAPGGAPDLRTAAAELAGFAEFAAIVRRHIDEACGTTEDAGVDILSRLSGIEAAMHEMLDYVSTSVTSGPAVAAVEKTQKGMDESLALIARLAEERETSATAAADQLAEVKAIGLGMTEMVRDIQRIAKQTYFLSINAGIEAVRAGPEGVGFAVVAREVRELSRQTDAVAKEIGSGIGKLEATIGATLRVVVEERDQRERASFSELTATFEGVSAHLARVVDHQNTLLDKVHRDSEAMVAPVMSLAASIQFQDITRQQLEHVGRSISVVAEHYTQLGEALENGSQIPATSLEQCLQEMHDGYVMKRQRTSHTGHDDEECGPAIELF